MLGEHRDADRGLDLEREAADDDGLLEHLQHAADDGIDRLAVGDVAQQDRELVAAEAGDRRGAAQHAVEPRADPLEQQVAVVVAERVVHVLEAVEVHQHHGGGRLRRPAWLIAAWIASWNIARFGEAR